MSGRSGHGSKLAVRVLLTGDSGVGKTSIVRCLQHMGRDALVTAATIGGDFIQLDYRPNAALGFPPFLLTVVDTQGSADFAPTLASFYRAIDGVIVVYDVSRKQTLASCGQRWIPEARSKVYLGPEVDPAGDGMPLPLLLLGNKSDLAPAPGTLELLHSLRAKLNLQEDQVPWTSAKSWALGVVEGEGEGEGAKQRNPLYDFFDRVVRTRLEFDVRRKKITASGLVAVTARASRIVLLQQNPQVEEKDASTTTTHLSSSSCSKEC